MSIEADTRVVVPLTAILPNGKSKPRVSARVLKAIDAIVWNGASRSEAAHTAGLKEDSLYRAMRLPHVLSALRQEFENRRTSEPFRAYARQITLAETSSSDDVKERANRWIAGCDGLAPVTKVAIQAQVSQSFDGIGFAPRTVDITPDNERGEQ